MSSQAFVRFREGIRKLHGDDCFVEFLQQLFPWVSITAGASSAACQIRSATDEISKFLHAAHDDDREGFVRLIRSTTERPRTSWSQLLHGQQTIRLCAKLSNFILDVFSFARPNMTVLQYACRDAVHQNGFFEARWELVYLTSDGATPAGTAMVSDCPPLVDTMSVFVQVESPAEQGHLEAPVRDVIIRIKVVPERQAVDNEDSSNSCNDDDDDDDDCPSLCSSEGSEATIRETSGVSGGPFPFVRQNAMSLASNDKVESDCVSTVASDSTASSAVCSKAQWLLNTWVRVLQRIP